MCNSIALSFIYMYVRVHCLALSIRHVHVHSKPLRLLYSLIIYEIVNFSFFTLYSLLLLSFFLYLKSVPIYVIVHVHACIIHAHNSIHVCKCTM